jgi:hypothetical protein
MFAAIIHLFLGRVRNNSLPNFYFVWYIFLTSIFPRIFQEFQEFSEVYGIFQEF